MDDEGAKKVIAAILRLTNKVDSLDRITVEAAAIANEGRQAAMDAADATNPKQIAGYIEKCVAPKLESIRHDHEKMYREFKGGAWRAMHDAAEAKQLFEKNSARLLTELDEFQGEKFWWKLKIVGFATFAFVGINAIGFLK